MALQKMVDDGIRLGGQASHIEISPLEAAGVLKELSTLSPPPIGFTLTSKEGASCKLLVFAKAISNADLETYVNNWKTCEWVVEFKKIPIIVVDPTPQTVHLHG